MIKNQKENRSINTKRKERKKKRENQRPRDKRGNDIIISPQRHPTYHHTPPPIQEMDEPKRIKNKINTPTEKRTRDPRGLRKGPPPLRREYATYRRGRTPENWSWGAEPSYVLPLDAISTFLSGSSEEGMYRARLSQRSFASPWTLAGGVKLWMIPSDFVISQSPVRVALILTKSWPLLCTSLGHYIGVSVGFVRRRYV